MEIKIVSEKENPLLKRREVDFQIEHSETGSTPSRLDVKKALAAMLKKDAELVFVRKFETKTGTHMVFGRANIYDSIENAGFTEPEYIKKRNSPPPEEPKKDEKG
jgi:small subunit ribosomal protein S24e